MDFDIARTRPAGLAFSARSARLLVLDDGMLGAPMSGRTGPDVAFRADSTLVWLGVALPDFDLARADHVECMGQSSVAVAQRLPELLARRPGPGLALIAIGRQDCLATMRGTAPTPTETVLAFEAIAGRLLALGICPVFVLPLPAREFRNGLFADRLLVIAATLRRLAREDGRILLADPTQALRACRARGIEPDEGLVGEGGQPTMAGAARLAAIAAPVLAPVLPAGSDADLVWHARGCSFDLHEILGLQVAVLCGDDDCGQVKLGLSGHYATDRGFVRIRQQIEPAPLTLLQPGDEIAASCDYDIADAPCLDGLTLHMTPVWAKGYAGVHSLGQAGLGFGDGFRRGTLRTPRFRLPQRLERLHLSVSAYVRPGSDHAASGTLAFDTITLRKTVPTP